MKNVILGITVSKYESASGVVRAVEKALMEATDREVVLDSGEACATIYVIQALPYHVGTNGNPWSPNYPTAARAVELCREHAPVEIRVAE